MFGDKIAYSQFNRREDDTFTFCNTSPNAQTFFLLGSDWVQDAFNLKSPKSIINPDQFLDYFQLIRDMEMNPKKIRGIRLLLNSFNSVQLSNPLKWVTTDADGNLKTFVDYPINLLALDQYQDRLVDLYYKDLVIGGNQFFAYKIEGNTCVTFTFLYDEFRLENLLDKDNPRQVNYTKADVELFEYLL